MLDHFDELVSASAKAISSIKFDKVVVWDAGGAANGDGSTATSNWLRNIAKTLPPMLEVMKEIGGVEFPEVLAKLDGQSATNVESKSVGTESESNAPATANDKDA